MVRGSLALPIDMVPSFDVSGAAAPMEMIILHFRVKAIDVCISLKTPALAHTICRTLILVKTLGQQLIAVTESKRTKKKAVLLTRER